MIGAIFGDITGSLYEGDNIKTKDFPWLNEAAYFTDDTVLTCALGYSILENKDFAQVLRNFYHYYPGKGYGAKFHVWANTKEAKAYNSFGNGSAMRTSPIAYAYQTLDEVLHHAHKNAAVTHNHIEGIKGAQAIASSIFLARKGKSKEEIKGYITNMFNYDLAHSIEEIRPTYSFNETCQGTVPQAIIAFLDSLDFEDAIRNAISIGGDSDTIACITGSIAEAYYGELPQSIYNYALSKLDEQLKEIVIEFYQEYVI